MNRLVDAEKLRLDDVDSEADFILCGENREILSEHCTFGEARMALYEEASRYGLGEHLPTIYRRDEPFWVPLS